MENFVISYPYHNNYSRTLTFKVMMKFERWEGTRGRGRTDVDELLKYFEKVDNLTRGIPKIAILTGWQQGGHDFQYPQWGPVDSDVRSSEHPEMTPVQALNYLIKTAREKYNTKCTVHVNLVDAYTDSPLWDYYLENEMICKNIDESWVSAWQGDGRSGYAVNMKNAWEKGTTKEQIDNLFAMLPELLESGDIHTDANILYRPSPYHGHTSDDMEKAYKAAICYIRNKYNADVTGEFASDEHYGFVAVGTSWSHESSIVRKVSPMKVPAYISAGGVASHGNNLNTRIFGSSVQYELDQYHNDPQLNVLGEFALNTLPYFFLNSKLRMDFNETKQYARFSDNVKSFIYSGKSDNNSILRYSHSLGTADDMFDEDAIKDVRIITQGDSILRIENDVFVPAVWKEKEIIAYSQNGSNRIWKLPADWFGVDAVNIYDLKTTGSELHSANVPVSNRELLLNIAAKQGLCIVPAGTNLKANDIKPTGGTAKFAGINSVTGGKWSGVYGDVGYDVFGGEKSLGTAFVSYIGSDDVASAAGTGALQSAPSSATYASGVKTSTLHQIVDVTTAEEQYVSLYLWDWNNGNRKTLIDAIDPHTQDVLDSVILDKYQDGKYVSFKTKGHIQLRLTTFYNEKVAGTIKGPALCGAFISANGDMRD